MGRVRSKSSSCQIVLEYIMYLSKFFVSRLKHFKLVSSFGITVWVLVATIGFLGFTSSFYIKANDLALNSVQGQNDLQDNLKNNKQDSTQKVITNGINTEYRELFCNPKNGTTSLPYKNLVVVDLNKYYKDAIFTDNTNFVVSEFVYELMYMRNNKLLPFNAIIVQGKTYSTTCDAWDFTLTPYLNFDHKYGTYVVGNLGDIHNNIPAFRDLIHKYKFDSLYVADLEKHQIDKESMYIASDFAKCKDSCLGVKVKDFELYKDALSARELKLKIESVKYPKKLKSLDKGEVVVKITNLSGFQIPNISYERLYIKELSSKNIPELYVKSWESLHIPVIVNQRAIGSGSSIEIKFDIGPYVYPKTYSGKFALYWGNKRLKDLDFSVKTSVYKGDQKLGYIVGRDLDYVNVRAKPDLRAKIAFKLDVGEYVIVNKVDGAWVNITSQYGDTGWVYKPLIRIK